MSFRVAGTSGLFSGPYPWIDVRAYGGVNGGTAVATANTAALRAAVAAAESYGVPVYVPFPLFGINDTITITGNAVRLIGSGVERRVNGGAFTNVGTRIAWTGAAGTGPMVKFVGSAIGTPALGHGIDNLVLDGNQLASIGLQILSSWDGEIGNVHIHECRTASLDIGTLGGADKNRGWNVKYLSLFNFSVNGSGITASKNVYDWDFGKLYARVKDGTAALDLLDIDDCSFPHVFVGSPGTAHAIELRGGDGTLNGARNLRFGFVYPNSGGIYVRAGSGGGDPARNISMGHLSFEDLIEPVLQYDAGVYASNPVLIDNLDKARPLMRTAAELLKWQNYTVDTSVSALATTSGRVEGILVPMAKGDVVTNIFFAVAVVSAGQTLSKVALIDSTGKIVAVSNDLGTLWNATGRLAAPLSAPYQIPKSGNYYLAHLSTGGTQPQFERGSANAVLSPAISGTGAMKPMFSLAGQTDFTLNATISLAGNSGSGWWVGWN